MMQYLIKISRSAEAYNYKAFCREAKTDAGHGEENNGQPAWSNQRPTSVKAVNPALLTVLAGLFRT